MPQYTPLWTSILRSPKVFALDPEAFRLWVLLLALAQEHDRLGGNLPGVDSVAFTLHMDASVLRRLTAILIDAGFLDESPDGGLMIHDWREWRRVEDPTSAARKRKQRDRERLDSSQHVTHVTPVTRDMNRDRDRSVTSVTDEVKPLRIARRSMGAADTHAKPGQKSHDVTDVTACHECHDNRTVHTGQNTNPLPPSGGSGEGGLEGGLEGGSSASPEPFHSPGLPPEAEPTASGGSGVPSPGSVFGGAGQPVIDRAAALWGPAGHDWAVEMLRIFPVEVVTYAARETVKWLNGRSFTPQAAAYWQRVCQNHRDGIPADPIPSPGRRASPAPKFTPAPADLTRIYHPAKLARMGKTTEAIPDASVERV